ncbi:citrate lyase beta chain [Mycobacterium lepraemurium]|nr:citrate lyase beta chain [Mycobacterium lepraemurium]
MTQLLRRSVGRRPAQPAGGKAQPGQQDPARGVDRGGRGAGQRRRDRGGQSAVGCADLRRRRLLAVPGGAGGYQLRAAGRISRRFLAIRARNKVIVAARIAGIHRPGRQVLVERQVRPHASSRINGRGAVGVNGMLVDAAHVKMAQHTLARAALINGTGGSNDR